MSVTAIDYEIIRALQDRTDVEEVLYKYSSAVDSFDKAGVRSCLADDIHAQYGNGEAVTDADTLANWIADATATAIWQHHLLNVYHVMPVNPDKFPNVKINAAAARAFAYFMVAPETQRVIAEFGQDKYGQALFVPDAGKAETEVGL